MATPAAAGQTPVIEAPLLLEAPPRSRGGVLFRLLPPLAVSAAVLGVWYLFSYGVLKPERRFLLPPPHEVVQVGILDWENLQPVLAALWVTTRVAMSGLALSVVLGIGFAVLMSQGKWVERSFYPYAVIIQTIPILALVPLIGFWFGFNFRSRVIACVLIAIFPIVTNTLFGLQSVDRGQMELFHLHGATRLTRLRKLQLPAALPAIFTGLRIAAGGSVIGAIVGDFFFRRGELGIGRAIDNYSKDLQTERLFTAAFFSSLLGIAIFVLFGWLGNRVLRSWHESARRPD